MGYREDVVYVYSSEGWNQLLSAIKAADSSAKKYIVELINACDEARVTSLGDRLLRFDSVKTTALDFEAFSRLHNDVDEDHYYGVYLGEDGGEDTVGGYCDNPFCVGVLKNISFDDEGYMYGSPVLDESNMGYDTPTIPAPAPIVDDHTCAVCGNTKCSKTEKSCWKCGAPI